jgi:hypothetical protein
MQEPKYRVGQKVLYENYRSDDSCLDEGWLEAYIIGVESKYSESCMPAADLGLQFDLNNISKDFEIKYDVFVEIKGLCDDNELVKGIWVKDVIEDRIKEF